MVEKRGRTHLVLLLFAVFVFQLLVSFNCTIVASANETSETVNYISKVHFINVGQGDCIFIEMPDGKTCIIDGGDESAGTTVVSYIQDLGYEKIDYMIATHSDADHIGGLSAVLVNFEVKTIFRPLTLSRYKSTSENGETIVNFTDSDMELIYLTDQSILVENSLVYAKFIDFAYKEEYNGELSEIRFLSDLTTNDLNFLTGDILTTIQILSPFAEEDAKIENSQIRAKGYKLINFDEYSSANGMSAVVLYSVGSSVNAGRDMKFLFCADVPTETEELIIEKASNYEGFGDRLKNIDCLKVAHHGGNYSTSEDFLNLLTPKTAVISVGDNDYGHPTAEVLERLSGVMETSNIFRTDVSGNVVMKISDNYELYVATTVVETGGNNWILYLVFGIIVFCVIAIIVINLIQKRIMKKEGITDFGNNETENDRFENNPTSLEFYDGEMLGVSEKSFSEKNKIKENTESGEKLKRNEDDPLDIQFNEANGGQITLLNPDELEIKQNKRRKRKK